MTIATVLGLIQAIGGEVLNFIPGAKIAQWAILAAAGAQKIVDAVTQSGTVITDDAGTPLSPNEVAKRIQDTLDRVAFKAKAIEQAGKDEINRSRAERGLPPIS